MSSKATVSHAAPVDSAYFDDKFKPAVIAEYTHLMDVFRTAIMSGKKPPMQVDKTDEVKWSELQRMAAIGDPALYQSNPADPNSAMAWYQRLAPRFGASPIPQQTQVFPGGAI